MASRRPSDVVLNQWFSAACTIDLNWATNDAFHSSYWAPNPTPSESCPMIPLCPPSFNTIWAPVQAHKTPSLGNPIPMDIDCSKRRASLPISCVWCGQLGHKSSPNCPMCFDIQVAIDVLQSYLVDKLAAFDMVSETLEDMVAEAKEEKDTDKGFLSCNKWIACPHCQTTIISLFYLLMKWMK